MSLDALLIEAGRSGDRLRHFMSTHHGESVYLTAVLGGSATAACASSSAGGAANGPLSQAIAEARSKVSKALHHEPMEHGAHGGHHGHGRHGRHSHSRGEDLHAEVAELRRENSEMREQLAELQRAVSQLQLQIKGAGDAADHTKHVSFKKTVPESPTKPAPKKDDEDDDFELFGSDDEEEDEEAARVREERLKAYADKKSKKPGVIAKSSVVLDVKPWDDETDMKEVENSVRTIEMDGLVWGASKLVPLAYGIKKLQVMCVVEDEKVSVDELTERIEAFEDLVQSVDIASFNKI